MGGPGTADGAQTIGQDEGLPTNEANWPEQQPCKVISIDVIVDHEPGVQGFAILHQPDQMLIFDMMQDVVGQDNIERRISARQIR